jgi:4-amino-4-deoxy-L-arabinose transferase-like glycosyltransferase
MHAASDEREPERGGAPFWVFALVLAAAVFLRFWNLGSAGISHWDAGTYTAGPLGVGPYAESDLVLFQTPPLVPGLFALAFDVWEPLDTLAIGIVALFGVATVLAVFLAGRNLVGDPAALAGAAALAGMEYHLLFSRQALTDVPFALFLLLAAWAFAAAAQAQSYRLAIAAGTAAGAAILTKYHGLLALAIAGVWTLVARDRNPRRAWALWLVACAVAAVPAVWLLVEIDRTIGLAEFRASRREWLSPIGAYLLPMTARLVGRSLYEWVSPFVLAPALWGFLVMLRRRTAGDLLVLVLAGLVLAALPFYRFYPRLLVPLLLPLALAAGVGVDAIARRLAPALVAREDRRARSRPPRAGRVGLAGRARPRGPGVRERRAVPGGGAEGSGSRRARRAALAALLPARPVPPVRRLRGARRPRSARVGALPVPGRRPAARPRARVPRVPREEPGRAEARGRDRQSLAAVDRS